MRSALRRARPAVWQSSSRRAAAAPATAAATPFSSAPAAAAAALARRPPARNAPAAAHMQRRALSFSYPAPRTLDEVVKIDLLETETPARVREIWDEYHLTKEDVVGQAWTRDEYGAFTEAAREAPMFVFPVRRDEGEFVMLSQVQEKHCILTFLDEYKLDPLGAAPWMSVTFYDDLAEDKELVLVRGDVSVPKLTRPEGLHLIQLLKAFYLEQPDMVDCFNNRAAEFDVMAHLSSCPQLDQPKAVKASSSLEELETNTRR